MNAQQLLDSLARRGHVMQLHPRGGFAIVPPLVLTDDERATLKHEATTLERLVRERQASENSGHRTKPTEATKPAAKLSPADVLLVRATQRKLPGSQLVGISHPDRKPPDLTAKVIERSEPVQPPVDQPPLFAGDPPPSEGSSLEQPATREPDSLDEVVEPSAQNVPSRTLTVEPAPVTSAIVASEVVEPSTRDEPAQLRVEIDAPEPEPEAPAADSSEHPEQSSDERSAPAVYEAEVPNTSSPEPFYEAEAQRDRSQRILLWVTAEIVRSRRTGRLLIELKVEPSPSTKTNGDRPIRFSIEESTSSAVHRYKVLDGPTNLGHGFRRVSPAAALRLAIEWWR